MKLDDYSLSKLSNEAENFKEDITNIINYGNYSAKVVTNTPPSWTARNGEFVFFVSGTVKRIYFYNNSAWDFIEYNAGSTGGEAQGYLATSELFAAAQDIVGLNFNIGSNESYVFDFSLKVTSISGNNPSFAITAPTGSTLVFWASANSNSLTTIISDAITVSGTFTRSMAAFIGVNWVDIRGTVQASATTGVVQLRAQSADVGGEASMDAGSFFRAKKVI